MISCTDLFIEHDVLHLLLQAVPAAVVLVETVRHLRDEARRVTRVARRSRRRLIVVRRQRTCGRTYRQRQR